ncbi:MAG: LPS assembly lipoprotein LptE [Planctomycetia bacterium]|nr:LPS assembly lipoprotein LptE [Planctomycetia bacterium]
MNRHAIRVSIVCLLALGVVGCRGYTMESLHRGDVKTVAVTVFHSREFRRQLEFILSEELVKAIELKTPYKIEHDRSRADTEIRGEVLDFEAPILSEDVDTDSPQEISVSLTVLFEWKDLRSGKVLASERVSDTGTYAVAVGQTLDSATTQAVRRVARKIVEAMEKPW